MKSIMRVSDAKMLKDYDYVYNFFFTLSKTFIQIFTSPIRLVDS